MANVSFTRDEVILALDVLYFSGDKHLGEHSQAIAELCNLLQDLPIHASKERPSNFRNTVGVSKQIAAFQAERRGIQYNSWRIGSIFHKVADDYKDDLESLHGIAECIRRNRLFLTNCSVGDVASGDASFPEGQLLYYLHRYIEQRDSRSFFPKERCEVCQLAVDEIYQPGEPLLEWHLTVSPLDLVAQRHYRNDSFIAVCPNCHAALHRFRPWLKKEACGAVLR